MLYHIVQASNDLDFGLKAKAAFYAAICPIKDLPRVILPTGNTPAPFYAALRNDPTNKPFHYLQLDEYHGLSADDPILFSNWLARDVLDPLNITNRMIFNSADDPASEIPRIHQWYRENSRVDLAVISIGENGHVGFNEPWTRFDSLAHMEEMTDQTWDTNCKYTGREVPRKVITLGMAELKLADQTILLVRGEKKAKILADALTGEITPKVPASYLQLQRNVIVIADAAALSRMPS